MPAETTPSRVRSSQSSWARLAATVGIQTTGYSPTTPASDITLGLVSGIDCVLWCYAFASLIFVGGLSQYLPLGVSGILASSAIIATVVALTSRYPVHVAGVEEQAVAILGTVAFSMNERVGEFAGWGAAAATMFALMALSAWLIGICLFLAARFNLGVLVQLIPFPVVCGFLAGTGWLFLSAAIQMMIGEEVSVWHLGPVLGREALVEWLPGVACGAAIYAAMRVKHHYLTLPLSLCACLAGFYAVAWTQGLTLAELRTAGWVFRLAAGGDAHGVGGLDLAHTNLPFIWSVRREVGIIVLLSMLGAMFSFSALELGMRQIADMPHEFRSHAAANIASGLIAGLPGSSDVAASILYRGTGATSRWTALVSASVCMTAAIVGGSFVEYIPKLVLGALIVLMAIRFLHDWLVAACRRMDWLDTLTVWLIFGVIVGVDFLVGVAVGLLLASLTFIVRFSQISVVGSDMPLSRLASNVERSATEQQFLQGRTQGMQVVNLRGYIFFGTANAFFEAVRTTHDVSAASAGAFAIFNFNRVSGIDSTGAQVFVKLITFLNALGITPVFCGLNARVAHTFELAEVFAEGDVLVVDDLDRALKAVEVRLLASCEAPVYSGTIQGVLREYLHDPEKIEQLASIMERIALRKGEVLFREGDLQESLYFIERGTVEVRLEQPDGDRHRLREFREGSVLGEMALMTDLRRRSATACAVEDSVVFRLEPSKFDRFGDRAVEYRSILHELIARLLAARLAFMNQRTRLDI